MSRSDALLGLQQLDSHIAALTSEIAITEAALTSDSELNRRRQVREGAIQRAAAAAKRARAFERDSSELTDKARQLERRLYSGTVGNPAELLVMQRELETLKAHMASVDDQLLEVMEETEAAESELREATKQVGAREDERASARETEEAHLVDIRRELDTAQSERSDRLRDIADEDIALYDRISAHHRPAVVRLVGESCGGCHLPLGIQEVRTVRASADLAQCSNCDRILAP